MQPEFVDESRKSLVKGLEQLFKKVAEDQTPVWVSLEAPSGWGKTRIVQEFYRSLAAGQPEPPYWPASILEEEDDDTAERLRKRVFPKVVSVPPAALPSWAWFGICCSHRGGVPVSALDSDMEQLKIHQQSLEAAWRKNATKKLRFAGWLRRRRGGVGKDAAHQVAGLFLPYWGLLFQASQEIVGAYRELAQRRVLRTQPRELVVGSREEVAVAFAEQLRRIAIPSLPIVLFVEDLHLADEVLLGALQRIMVANSGAIMLITSTWKEHLADAPQSQLLEQVPPERVYRVSSGANERDRREPFLEAGILGDLNPESRMAIARSYFPEASDRTCALIAERYTNPFALELYCQMSKGNRKIEGSQDLTPEDLDQAPPDVLGIYRAMWKALPPDMRMSLALSALGSPDAINRDSGQGDDRWNARAMASAIEQAGLVEEGIHLLQFPMGGDRDSFDWARSVDEWLQRFVEVDQRSVALEYAESQVGKEDHDDLLRLLGESLIEVDIVEISEEQARHRARTLLALFAAGKIAPQAEIGQAAVMMIEAIPSFELNDRKRIAEVGLHAEQAYASNFTPVALKLRYVHILARVEAGEVQVNEAINLLRELLADQEAHLEPGSPEVFHTRYELAVKIADYGQPERSLELLEELLQDQLDSPEPDQLATFATRNSIAIRKDHKIIGDTKGALADLEALLKDKVRVLGSDHPSTFITRNSIAIRKAKLGNPEAALADLEALLKDKVRVLGSDHPSTLKTRNAIPIRKVALQRFDEAAADFSALIADKNRILGQDHPSTLKSRFQQARCIAQAGKGGGKAESGIHEFEQLLGDQARVLGANHERTLETRSELVTLYLDVGIQDKCLEALRGLIKDRIQEYGPDDQDLLALRSRLCIALDRFKVVGEDVEALQVLLAEQLRLLGEDDQATLMSRFWLLEKKLLRGDLATAQALKELSDVHVRQEKALGADHAETLQTLSLIAQLRSDPK